MSRVIASWVLDLAARRRLRRWQKDARFTP